MSNKKQTAVEWLEDALSLSLMIRSESMRKFTVRKLIEQAKEMEKQQIIDFANNFIDEHTYGDYDGSVQTMITVKQYYNENYEI
jgi:hypothetical protein